MYNQAKDLFQTQAELVDAKVEIAVTKAIDRVVQQITELRNDMHDMRHEIQSEVHGLRGEMTKSFSSLENRVIAVETKLGMVNKTKEEVRSKAIDYVFKGAWLILAATYIFITNHIHLIIH